MRIRVSRLMRQIGMRRLPLVGLALALVASAATAQTSTGTLRGQIKDQLGGLVVGASVIAINAQNTEKSTTSNGEGVYTFTNLAPGAYTVKTHVPGFSVYTSPTINLMGASTQRFDIQLEVELKPEEVTIGDASEKPNVDPDSNLSGLTLRGADLDVLSDDPDQMAEDLRVMASTTGGPDGVQFFVDGFSGGKLPSKSSIREVRINANPYASDQETFGFGRVEIITKPGTEKLRGQAFFNFNNQTLNARNAFAPTRAPFQSRLFGASLSGPIIAKKLAYFLDFERRDINENAVVSASILDSSLNVTQFSESIVTPQTRTSISARLDYQLNPAHTLVIRYNYGRANFRNAGVGGLSLLSRAYDVHSTDHTLQVTEAAILAPTVLNETRFQFIRTGVNQDGGNALPAINVQGAFIGGGSPVGNASSTADRFELQNMTIWTKNSHTLKAGARLRGVRVNEIAPTNFAGTFIFSSLEQYKHVLLGVPGAHAAQFTISGGNPRASVSRLDFGAFAQDDWRWRPNFTLSLGFRYETQTNEHHGLDFAPRIAFAWAPGVTNKTPQLVIRGGFGLFYSRFGEELTLEANRSDGINQQRYIVTNPEFFLQPPTAAQLTQSAQPQTVWRIADQISSRYSMKSSISVERQLPHNTTASISYVYEKDLNALHARNINAPLPGTYDPANPASGVRPFGNVGNIFLFESGSKKSDNTLSMTINSRFHKKFSFFGTIGLSRETGDVIGPNGFPANSYDFQADYGRATNDVRAFLRIGGTINTFWGVTLNPLIRYDSPTRFNITTGRDTNGDGVFMDRPALTTNLSKPGVIITPLGAFDPNPGPDQTIIPRNFGTGAGVMQVNLRASKSIRFGSASIAQGKTKAGEKPFGLTFTIQGLNILNHTNLGGFIGNLDSPLFGRANSSFASRRIDLGIRFTF
jgi:hypothetical protein